MRNLARRSFLLAIGVASLLPIRAQAAPGTASDVVKHFFDALVSAMKNGPALGARGRYQKLEPVVLAAFDVPFMTRMSVGLGWGRLSPEDKKRAITAFGRYVTATYARQFDKYDGEKFEVGDEQKVPHGTIVKTRIVQPDDDKTAINYVLHDNDIAWQIRDVYLTGTISELATRRSEFSATLRTGGIDALISRLNQRADDL